MEFKDYYGILGVARDAKADHIKRAWRKLARKYHPDVSKESDSAERMKEINEAYEVLGDEKKRAAYDQVGQSWNAGEEFRPPPDWDTGFEFYGGPGAGSDHSDFFESLFGGMRGGAGHRSQGYSTLGEDHHASIVVDLDDALHGAIRQITLRAPEADASGRIRLGERVLNVTIPTGVHQGQVIRLAGQGNPGLRGGRPGDLYLEVHFRPHRLYRPEGRDLYLTLPVAPWEAALGATLRVPTPGGSVDLQLPPNTANRRKLRLKGRGLPAKPPGDLYVIVEVVLPEANSDKARQLYATMARELAFDPRKDLGA
jgi:curved DNA-binding protein